MYKVGDLVRFKVDNRSGIYIVDSVWVGVGHITIYSDTAIFYNYSSDVLEPVTHLTTKEFIKLVEDMGYEVVEQSTRIVIYGEEKGIIAYVRLDYHNRMDTDWNQEVSSALFKLLSIYAKTPLELREEIEQLYTLELPNTGNEYRYYAKGKTEYMFDDIDRITGYQKIFAQKEIDELPNQELIKTLIKKEVKNENI